MRLRLALPVAALLAAAGCSYTVASVSQVPVHEGRLDTDRKMPALACEYRLQKITDGRPASGDSGRLNLNVMHVEDAAATIGAQLRGYGLRAPDAPSGRDVAIELKQMYLTQHLDVKIPVVVYGVQVGGASPYLVRSEASTLNWVGSKGEAYSGFARALADANHRLLESLNQRCA